MIIITENITNKKIAYAKNDAEFTDSLFNPVNVDGAENNRGTLAIFHKIENKKNAALYWIDEKRGYFKDKKSGLWGQFGKIDNKIFYQYTLAEIIEK